MNATPNETLFGDLLPAVGTMDEAAKPKGVARVLLPNRWQIELRPSDLESLLSESHRARIVWGYVERQKLVLHAAGARAPARQLLLPQPVVVGRRYTQA